MNRHQRQFASVALVAAMAGLAGCAEFDASPNLNLRFGEAVRQGQAVQTMRPEASQNRDPVAGLDAESARNAIVLYQNSFKTPPPTFVPFIGGGIGSAQ